VKSFKKPTPIQIAVVQYAKTNRRGIPTDLILQVRGRGLEGGRGGEGEKRGVRFFRSALVLLTLTAGTK
jgi:hypothetical protein